MEGMIYIVPDINKPLFQTQIMKYKFLSFIVLILVTTFCFSGCAEEHYYHENHHHSPEYSRHHQPVPIPPPGVEFEIHN